MSEPMDQKAKRFLAPPAWMMRRITRANVWVYRRSDGRFGGVARGMRHLLLTTTGRRSGDSHTVALPYWLDGDGRRIVVASYGGGPRNPAWYYNLADRTANPVVVVQDGAESISAEAEILTGDERVTIWAAMVVDRPFYDDYAARTERQIPVIRLVPASS